MIGAEAYGQSQESTQPVPTTAVQQQIWYSGQVAAQPALSHLAMSVLIRGPLDTEALRRSLQTLCARHQALRTVFPSRDGELLQRVQDYPALQLASYNLELADPRQRTTELTRLVDRELLRPFDLANGPLVRFALFGLDFDESELLVMVHRLVADEHSLAVLARDLLDCYSAFSQRTRPVLALVGQFTDYALAHHDDDHTPVPPDERAYLQSVLADSADPLELSFSRRGSDPDAATGTVLFSLPERTAEAIRALADSEHTTVDVVVLAAFGVLLHRYTRRNDLVLGTTADGRSHPLAAGMVGPLTDLRVLRLELPYDPTWRAVVHLCREAMAEAHAPGRAGFRDVLQLARQTRHPSTHPVFQVLFAPAPNLPGAEAVNGVVFSFTQVGNGRSLFDLELRTDATEDDVTLALTYRQELFEVERMRALIGQLEWLLERATLAPDAHLSWSCLLGDEEYETVVRGWNQTTVDYPRDAWVHGLFEEWADRTPDAIALCWDDAETSYGELERRANQLAHYLRGLGVVRETRVGLYFGYTADWVVGAMATLKAGGAYVPLDPAYPPERLAVMCAAADVKVLLLHRRSTALTVDGVRQVRVDDEADAIAALPSRRHSAEVDPDDLAYVMFTSGSTGRPKGIGITHRNIIRTVRNTRDEYVTFEPSYSVAQASNISFDATTLETWGALLNGGRLVGLRKEDVLDPYRLKQQLVKHAIDVMFLPAALMKQHVGEAPDTFSSLRYLLSGGEQADFHALRRIIEHGAPEVLVNPYGPTEATVNATAYRCNDLGDSEILVPIGRPVENTTCYILDQFLQPLPPGVVGELFVGGDGVGRGYLSQPELTSERFVPDPWADEPGARLYRSGDLARYRSDGVIEFLGRMDRQVKVRGFRIEPGEIENCLLRSDRLREVSVQVGRDRGGDQVLVAYVVPKAAGLDLAELGEYARRKLPTYMVPRRFVPLPSLPLNANGKLDAAALGQAGAADEAGESGPITPTEEHLLSIWRALLGVENLGVHDDFFAAGGHSLLVAEVISRASAALGCELPYRLVVEQPTVAGFAAAADRLRPAGSGRVDPGWAEEVAGAGREGGPPAPAAVSSGEVTERVLAIWRDVLDAPALGVNDDFFAAGGQSLKTARVAARVRTEFGVEPPLRMLFEHPTVAAFAAELERLLAGGGEADRGSEIARATDGGQDIGALLDEVEHLSDEEIARLLGSGD